MRVKSREWLEEIGFQVSVQSRRQINVIGVIITLGVVEKILCLDRLSSKLFHLFPVLIINVKSKMEVISVSLHSNFYKI